MKIKDLIIGEEATITLVVTSAVAKSTRNGKPYLFIEFFDGTEHINANYWDWVSGNIPSANAILDVLAQVTEWQGVKQLTIRSLRTNTTASLSDFSPKSEYNIDEYYNDAFVLAQNIQDETIRTIVTCALEELKESWLTVPGAVTVHHNFVGGTLVHSYNVAIKARAMAHVTEGADTDLAIAGGLLHDIGKLFTYCLDGVNIDRTANGRLYEHIFMGAEFIGNFAETHVNVDMPDVYNKVRLLRHIILSHHGSLEYGSPITPQCIEAYIVHYADMLDATNEQIKVASKNATTWTDKIWALNNRPHLSHNYVAGVMLDKTVQ